ncbi:MAG TPA: phosphoribosylglycinamide formyltransferase [Thermoplasmata archaeon]|nr:phosphoribosylglycinamide formyltransferase [Thermoplasmata archaeon]
MTRVLPIALLVSGEGTTLDALAERIAGGHLPARVALVVSDRPHAPAIERARLRGLPTLVLSTHGVEPEEWGARLTRELEQAGAELVVLAGFLSILPASWVHRWQGRAINIHPSLLPRYGGPGMYGRKVLQAVLAARERTTGATVHLVTNEVDGGTPLAQERVPVAPDDTVETLRARLHPVEVALLSGAIRQFAEGSLPLPYPEPGASAPVERDRADVRR